MRLAHVGMCGLLMVCLAGFGHAAGPATAPASQPAIEPKAANLAEAIEDWIVLLEKNDLNTANARWARDPDAAGTMQTQWDRLRAGHQQYNYRKWLDARGRQPGAKQIGAARKFAVGGHTYDYLNIDWEKTDAGWRISNVWMCR